MHQNGEPNIWQGGQMLFVLAGMAGTALAAFLAYRFLLRTDEDREAFWLLLGKRFRPPPLVLPPLPATEPAPAPAPPPKPEPVPEPEPEVGNVKPEKSEWGTEPETSKAYVFPERTPAVTRYEDLNRRLIVLTESSTVMHSWSLPLRALDDHPVHVSCTVRTMHQAIKNELRCAYPVIIDPLGWFAAASRELERNPYFNNSLVQAYLSIPEQRRPVVVSHAKPLEKANKLGFLRYEFQDYSLDVSFLNPHSEQSIAYVFEQFLQPRDVWLWFSPARLRKHITDLNRPLVEAKSLLQQVLTTNNFAMLWKLRQDQPPETLPPPTEIPQTATVENR